MHVYDLKTFSDVVEALPLELQADLASKPALMVVLPSLVEPFAEPLDAAEAPPHALPEGLADHSAEPLALVEQSTVPDPSVQQPDMSQDQDVEKSLPGQPVQSFPDAHLQRKRSG
jgi:hypothetical protein